MPPMLRTMYTLLWRGLLLRCPRCGQSKLFERRFKMHVRCANCGWVFEREEGYWTGAMALNLVASELVVVAVVIPLVALHVPLLPLFAIGLPLTALFPLLFYRHSKSLWMSIDFLLNPVALR